MGKTTNRVLSALLTVLMVISMVSVFVIPANAAADTSAALDYDALFEGEDSFFINPDWITESLTAGDKITFWFRGEKRELKYDPKKHFASYEDAYDSIWGVLNESNYLTYQPNIFFAPGDYMEVIHIPGNGRVFGANAGISPNADIAEEDWNIVDVMENGGWKENPDRDTSFESYFYESILFTTRTDNGENTWTTQEYTGDNAKYAYYKEKAYNATVDNHLSFLVDGITAEGASVASLSGHDKSSTNISYNNEALAIAGGRKVDLAVNNVIFTGTDYIAGGWNSTNDIYNVTADAVRSTDDNAAFVQRYIKDFTITNSYITGKSGSFINSAYSYSKMADCSFNMEHCIVYNCTGATFQVSPNYNNFMMNVKDNIMYNFFDAKWGGGLVYGSSGYDITMNFIDNEIYHDKTTNTMFNGNPEYLKNGRLTLNFNGNKVIGTLANVPPNSNYSAADAATILDYNFDGNFLSDSVDGVGRATTFVAGPESGSVLASGWDYTDTNYFYDYNMNYSTHGLKIVSADMGENNITEVGNSTILARCYNTKGDIVPVFTTNDEAAGNVKAKVEIATDLAFENVVESIDIDSISETATYYVRSYYEGSEYERVYKLQIVAATPVDFNDAFMSGGMSFAGVDLNYKNTAIYVAEPETEGDGKYAYGFIGDTYYRFEVDDELVFDAMAPLALQMDTVEDPYVILPSGDYGDETFDFAATYLGTNAEIDPVDDTVSVTKDGSDWIIGGDWGKYGETTFDVMTVADGLEGKLKIVGITLRGQFNDTLRTYGKDGDVYDTLDIELRNIVADQEIKKSYSEQKTDDVIADGITGNTNLYLFNLTNRRSVNFNETQTETDSKGGTAEIEYPGFGDTYNDSFTLKSVWIKNTQSTGRFMNEYIPAHVTFDNVYRDCTESNANTILGWYKIGYLNKNSSFTMVNCNFREAVEESNAHPLIGLEGASGMTSSDRIIDGGSYKVTIDNNVFYNANRDTHDAAQPYILLSPAYMTSIEINNNFAFNNDATAISFVDDVEKHAGALSDPALPIVGKISVEGNDLIGFTQNNVLLDFGMGENNPVLANTFYTTNKTDYASKYVGISDSSMNGGAYYLDLAHTKLSTDHLITSVGAKTEGVGNTWLDDATRSFGATVYEGTLADVDIVLPEGATGTWSTDKDGANTFTDKTTEEIGYASTYYYTVTKDDVSIVYSAVIYTVDQIIFAEDFEANGYFDKNAVIITPAVKDIAAGTDAVIKWDGIDYYFKAGVNAFDTVANAIAAKRGTVDVIDMLITKEYGDATYQNGAVDLILYANTRFFAPNYDINPVVNDGFGQDSASQGEAWGLNGEFVNDRQILVREISVDWATTGVAEAYGFTCTRRFIDTGRKAGTHADIKIENIYFSGENFHVATKGASQYLFHFDRGSCKDVNGTSTFTCKNAYFFVDPLGGTRAARLIGERMPAHVIFDGIYIDFENNAIQDHGNYLKQIANNSSFVLKNSCLVNSETTNSFICFEGYIDDIKGSTTSTSYGPGNNPWKPGRSNTITYENNIFSNFTGMSSSNLMHVSYPYGYTAVTIKDNYVSGRNDDAMALLYAANLSGKAPEGFSTVYTITGNVINGMTGKWQIGQSGKYYPSNFNWVVKDNFVTYTKTDNIYADGVKGYAPVYETRNMEDGVNLDYSHRIDAKGLVPTNVIYDMEFVDGATVDGDVITVNTADGCGIVNGNNVTLANIVKTNDKLNILRTKVEGGYVDARTAVPYADELILEVRSADNKTAIKQYKVRINVTDAPAFKGNFTDSDPIVNEDGVKEPILDTAVMVSAKFAGKTGTVNAEWNGAEYSFTMGENAFATAADALNYAKTNSKSNFQILFKNEAESTLNIGVTYPAKFYTENYNIMPYVTDGYGPESPTYGEGWAVNQKYMENQTKISIIAIGNVAGEFEFNGFTITGFFSDAHRAVGNKADVTVRNTVLDIDTANHGDNAKSKTDVQNILGSAPNGTGWNTYAFRLGSKSNLSDTGNSFVIKDLYIKDNSNMGLVGEYQAYYTEYNGVYVADSWQSQFNRGSNWVKQPVGGSELVMKNCNFQKVMYRADTTGYAWWYFEGTGSGSAKAKFTADNNIFNSFETRTFSKGDPCLFNLNMSQFSDITVTNNYIASPYNLMGKTNLAVFGTYGVVADTINNITADYIIKYNVFNTNSGIDVGVDGKYYPKDTTFAIEGNYRIPGTYVEDVAAANPIGRNFSTNNKGAIIGAYALNYDRTVMSDTVLVPDYTALENLYVEENGNVVYVADDALTSVGGKISGKVDHLVNGVDYGTLALVVDGNPAELNAQITDAETVAFKVTSYDGKNSKLYTVTVTDSVDHSFTDYEFNDDANCMTDGTKTAVCDGTCGDAACGVTNTIVAEGTKTDHVRDESTAKINNDATCKTSGTISYTCKVEGCGAEIKVPTGVYADHLYEESAYRPYTEATCIAYGTEIATCKWCTSTNIRSNAAKYPILPDNHAMWSDWSYNNDATCVKDGTDSRICTCGTVETRASAEHTKDTVAHTYGEYHYNGDATCEKDGTMTARCTVDGCRAKVTVKDPANKANAKFHVWGAYVANNDATCCENGTKTATCTVCGDKKTATDKNSALGHADATKGLGDVESGKWYSEAVNYVVAHEYISGMSATEFGISTNITRGMFVTILARIAGVNTSNNKVSTKFTDVEKGRYYTAAIKWASEKGIVSGMSDTTFAPNANITRQQLAVMLVNFAKSQKVELKANTKAVTFADAKAIAGWASEEVAICQKAGIISGYTENGKTYFKPQNTATRAEAAQMIYKFIIGFMPGK